MSKSSQKKKGRAAGAPKSAADGRSREPERVRSRLFLVTDPAAEPEAAAAALAEALAGGDVAAVLISATGSDEAAYQRLAERLAPLAQGAGAAAIVVEDSRAAGRAKADGVHMQFSGRREGGEEAHEDLAARDIRAAIERFHPDQIVGVGNIRDRHDAMSAAEDGCDYVFFGLLDLAPGEDVHPKTLAFAEWWAEVFEIPCVALAGTSLASVADVAETGADFIAVREAVWSHPEGPRAAVAEANRLIDAVFASADGTSPA